MEPNKFEQQLKERLRSREIKPSEEAWGRISDQLEVSQTRTSPRFWKYGIAAGLIGILFLSVLFFTNEEPLSVPNTEITEIKKDAAPARSETESNQGEEADSDGATEDNAIIATEVRQEKIITNSTKPHMDRPAERSIVDLNGPEDRHEKVVLPSNTSEALISNKVNEVVDQIELLENKKNGVTEAEIDSLLRAAQRQLLKERLFNNGNSVDARALLADVEDELDQSFRDQIFDALKEGYLKVRTGVADRNK
ncbi:hypothetical protein RQM65_05390 [Pricia sp. S334]|uniref:Anti-sigma factor n=1 Tax=Pricia mediterranea TaxID=3076079 RepID=A0ABU3L338_9FLAO|nr:hypothetical protein [Pricia sp. S334]MDT7828097.1 hypothetical protein [Pricia sp. S334]